VLKALNASAKVDPEDEIDPADPSSRFADDHVSLFISLPDKHSFRLVYSTIDTEL
jgi:hypothetical protein